MPLVSCHFITATQSLKNGFVIEDIKMDGKVALITGSNRGIGFEAALDFAKRGAKVLLACRDVEKGEEAKRKVSFRIIPKHCQSCALLFRSSCLCAIVGSFRAEGINGICRDGHSEF